VRSDFRLYFVSVLLNISVSVFVSVNEIICISVSVSITVNKYITAQPPDDIAFNMTSAQLEPLTKQFCLCQFCNATITPPPVGVQRLGGGAQNLRGCSPPCQGAK